jgi:hypothetical protein
MSCRQVDGNGDVSKLELQITLQHLALDWVTVLLSMETVSSYLVGLQMIVKIPRTTSLGI